MVFTKRYYGYLILIAVILIGMFVGAQVWIGKLVNQWISGVNLVLILAQVILLLLPILLGYREFVKVEHRPSLFLIEPSKTTSRSLGIWGSIGVFGCGLLLMTIGLLDGEYVDAISSLSIFASFAMIIRITVVGSTYAKVYEDNILLPIGSIPLDAIEGYRIQSHSTGHGTEYLLQFKIKKHYGIKIWMGALPHIYVDEINKEKMHEFLKNKTIPYQQYM